MIQPHLPIRLPCYDFTPVINPTFDSVLLAVGLLASVLTEKLADIHAVLFDYERTITQQELIDFIRIEYSRVGADVNITPREIIRDFIELLNIAYQDPGASVSQILSSSSFDFAKSELQEQETDSEFAEFTV